MSNSYPNAETVHQHQLPNGIKLLMYQNPVSELVVVRGSSLGGALTEPKEKAGLASFTAQMLLRGTESRSFEEIYADMEAVGATVYFSSGYRQSSFGGEALKEDIDLVLDLITSSLREPTFPDDHIELIRAQNITGLQMRENDTQSMARLKFSETLYPDHPYGTSSSGYLDTMNGITRDDLVAFHQKQYAPEGMVIVVVGDIEPADIIQRIESRLGNWDNPQYIVPPEFPDASRPAETIRLHTDMPDKTQSDIVIGLPGPRRNDPNFMDLRVANTILGVFGMMGRLGENVRVKQGLAYYARSSLSSSMGPYPWVVSTGVSPDKVDQAINSIFDEIKRMQTELVPVDELSDTQAYLTGSLPMGLETNGGLASTIMSIETLDLGWDYLEKYTDAVNSITPERVQKAAQDYLSTDEVVISVAGPVNKD